ncbi:choline ABC transporter substrate-binding protein [Aliiroseovarius crassostreae]|uniref:choline ABC transporter substrate-binding protein n=1 Tax=Aliiroseovarius crassostreae TaxID=154981 RepID=UPI0021AEFF07|nr:choline ABC transporter substrate-binding protein [Aliiroseovarius crassostreae]UWQ04821.1 choline ABC transporter substrate-binding protein [Aliiroseovarius crassostreae]
MKLLIGSSAIALALSGAGMAQASCEKVRMAEPGWTDLALTTGVATVLLEGLGYETETSVLGTTVIYEAMVNKDLDVFLGYWDPAMTTYFTPYAEGGKIDTVHQNLQGAKFTFAVPKYVHDAGVRDFADLANHAEKFGQQFYGIEPGSNGQMMDIVKSGAFGLGDWTVVESSEQGMLAQVRRTVSRGDWVVFLGWAPHPMNVEFEIEYLTGGDDYFGPEFGAASVHTQVRTGYIDECPNVGKLLKQLSFTVDLESEGMDFIISDGEDPDEAATRLIRKYPDLLTAWLSAVKTQDGQPGLPAVRSHLGLE